jgi:hypothetical protein
MSFRRPFYDPVILRGEGLGPDESGIIQQGVAKEPMDQLFVDDGLLGGIAMTRTAEIDGGLRSATLLWSGINFSKFAFDLLAVLKGTYRSGYGSSLHGLDLPGLKRSEGPALTRGPK